MSYYGVMISLDDIRGLAVLARLKLTGAEEESLQKDISSILDYVEAVSTAKIPSLSRDEVPQVRNVVRDDAPSQTLGARDNLLGAFPTREGDFNVVRKIIQKDEPR